MATLKIERIDAEFAPVYYELPKKMGEKVNIGNDLQNDIVLHENDIVPFHGLIMRASNGFYSVLNNSTAIIKVNDLEIHGFKILRHKDVAQLGSGSYKLTYLDISKFILDEKSSIVGVACLFCQDSFQIGSEVILCPKCDTAYHVSCWKIIYNQACLLPNCGYFIDKLDE